MLFPHDQGGCVVAGCLKTMAVGDGVSGTSLHTVTAKDTAVVVDVIDLRVTFGAAVTLLGGILRCLYVDAVGGTGGGTQEAGDALLKAVLIALKYVGASVSSFNLCGSIGVNFRDGGLEKLLERDAHPLCYCRGGANYFTDFRHWTPD